MKMLWKDNTDRREEDEQTKIGKKKKGMLYQHEKR